LTRSNVSLEFQTFFLRSQRIFRGDQTIFLSHQRVFRGDQTVFGTAKGLSAGGAAGMAGSEPVGATA